MRSAEVAAVGAQTSYVLITPARNEGAFLEKTIESVIHQTILPTKWVIVDDGSTDRTPEIIGGYLQKHPWLEMVQMPQRRDRSFAGKVQAFNAGFERVKDLAYEVVGNLDADISFGKDHFEFLMRKFFEDPDLVSPGPSSRKKGTIRQRTASRGTSMFPGSASCSGEVAGRKSAVISRTVRVASTGWP